MNKRRYKIKKHLNWLCRHNVVYMINCSAVYSSYKTINFLYQVAKRQFTGFFFRYVYGIEVNQPINQL